MHIVGAKNRTTTRMSGGSERGARHRPNRRRRPNVSEAPHLWSTCPPALATNRESIEVSERTRVVLGDIQNKGLVPCSLDSRLSNPAQSPPLKLPSLNTDLYRLPNKGSGCDASGGGGAGWPWPRPQPCPGQLNIYYMNVFNGTVIVTYYLR